MTRSLEVEKERSAPSMKPKLEWAKRDGSGRSGGGGVVVEWPEAAMLRRMLAEGRGGMEGEEEEALLRWW